MSKRSKACDISPKVRAAVKERDGGRCIYCGSPAIQIMHFVKRSQGGLGIEQNLACGCIEHHQLQESGDEGANRYLRWYLSHHYPNWSEKDLVYDKWKWAE